MLKNLAVIIVFFNGDVSIIDKVAELRNLTDAILVVDNNSMDSCETTLNELSKIADVSIVRNSDNMGVGYALNQGIEFAKSHGKSLLLTLDQDSIIPNESVINLERAIDIDKGIVSVGPDYKSDNKEAVLKRDKEVHYLITSGNLIDVTVASKIGGYREDFFIDAIDIEFSFRLISNGYTLLKVANATMSHKIGEYERSPLLGIRYLGHSPKRYYYKFRNGLIVRNLYWKQLPFDCIKLSLSSAYEFLRIIIIEKNRFVKLKYAIRGLKDGLLQ